MFANSCIWTLNVTTLSVFAAIQLDFFAFRSKFIEFDHKQATVLLNCFGCRCANRAIGKPFRFLSRSYFWCCDMRVFATQQMTENEWLHLCNVVFRWRRKPSQRVNSRLYTWLWNSVVLFGDYTQRLPSILQFDSYDFGKCPNFVWRPNGSHLLGNNFCLLVSVMSDVTFLPYFSNSFPPLQNIYVYIYIFVVRSNAYRTTHVYRSHSSDNPTTPVSRESYSIKSGCSKYIKVSQPKKSLLMSRKWRLIGFIKNRLDRANGNISVYKKKQELLLLLMHIEHE